MAQETNTWRVSPRNWQAVVARVAPSVVRIDDGSRLTATGIVWSPDGLILTTSHGTERDEDVVVELADGTRLPATLVGRDEESDLALLRVTATDLPAVTLADAADGQGRRPRAGPGPPRTAGPCRRRWASSAPAWRPRATGGTNTS